MIGRRIQKLVLFRLLFVAFLLFCSTVLSKGAKIPFYSASVFICFLSIFYVVWYLTRRRYQWLALVQITGDILIETYLLAFTGGAESLFAVFYPLSILSAALVLGDRKSVIFTTVLSCLGFTMGAVIARQLELNNLMIRDVVYFFYSTTARVGIFLIIGYLSRYLSGTIVELRGQLKLSERLSFLGEVVSKISHEIRNPLTSVRTAADVLRDSLRGKLNPQEEKMMVIIGQESDRMTKTFQRILSYVKQSQSDPKILLLDGLIERTLSVARLNPGLHFNGVLVEKKYDTKTHIYADEEQILCGLLNLTLNAYQAMPDGGTFKITAKEELRGTQLDLEDSGGGIPAEKLKDLFLPFKSTKKGGTGLGLAEVQKIVTLHEGKIEVETLPGKGSIFHLYFPKP